MNRKAKHLITLCRNHGIKLATAESCTGGLLSGAITTVPGASDVFDRGFVTYSNGAKVELLGVEPAVLSQFGAVSEEVAYGMAAGAITYSAAHMAVSITGLAGPGGSAHKPEGRVCFGFAWRGHATVTETIEFGALGRTKVRRAAVLRALDIMITALEGAA
ncbi:MAG: CinA family protein [Deltaproteobacteria bacterium]